MEIIEDADVAFLTSEAQPSPIFKSKLKRLKKSFFEEVKVSEVSIGGKDDKSKSLLDLSEVSIAGKDDKSKSLLDLSEVLTVEPESAEIEKETMEEELDPLFSVPAFDDEDFETMDLEKKKSVRKRLDLNEEIGDDLKWNMKRKRKSADKFEGKLQEPVRLKKTSKKVRKAELEQIHADSQRLLRETRDASFKPVPLIQKPISSVLEKIRQRKLEVSKQTSFLSQPDIGSLSDCTNDEFTLKKSEDFEGKYGAKVSKEAAEETAGKITSSQDLCGEASGKKASKTFSEVQPTSVFSDTQVTTAAKFCVPSNENNDHLKYEGDEPKSPFLASDLNPDPDNLSSEDESQNDDENLSPCFPTAVNNYSQEPSLAKFFLDDEAEEEDDSDHDLLRFQDSEEEDDESDADEVLKNLIATNYEEASVDREKRNLLHQKWLEQQDAAGTDDILQRLKYGPNQKIPNCLDDEDDCDNFGDESEDEKSNDQEVRDNTRSKSKKAKQMIVRMFNDETDVYEHSDEEAAEQTVLRHRMLKKIDSTTFISPVEDEHSKEVFDLIKKTNSLPSMKKKGKAAASSFDSIMTCGNSDSSSKSSFLNRTTSFSLPSKPKQVSTTMRAYIFNRDDSKSRGAADIPNEDSSDQFQDLKEAQTPKGTTSKVSNKSQIKSTSKTKEPSSNSISNSSLFQILKRSSMHFDKKFSENTDNNESITKSQAAYQFSSFKLGTKTTKGLSRK